jgi:hypothetical protein
LPRGVHPCSETLTRRSLTRAHGIDERGQIAGSKLTNPGQVPQRHVAAVWKDGQVTELGYPFGAQLRGPHSVGTGIDDKGQDRLISYSFSPPSVYTIAWPSVSNSTL